METKSKVLKRHVSPEFAKIVASWSDDQCKDYIESIIKKLSDKNCIQHMKPIYETGKDYVETVLYERSI